MKINYKKGRRCEEDRIITITTKKEEPATIFRVALLINQLAINESKLWANIYNKNPKFLFGEFLKEVIEHGKKGIDWAHPENENEVLEKCNKYHITPEKIDYDLLKRAQTRLTEFLEDK